jgi:hypothetical protein
MLEREGPYQVVSNLIVYDSIAQVVGSRNQSRARPLVVGVLPFASEIELIEKPQSVTSRSSLAGNDDTEHYDEYWARVGVIKTAACE